MRAVAIAAPGGVEQLAVVSRTAREPGPGEVRIAVRAAAVNPTDVVLRRVGADDLPPPWIPGMDATGMIESVGPEVARLKVGDEVMAVVSPRRPEGGAQQELLVVPAASVVPIPTGASPEQAATLPMNGLTALLALELLDLPQGAALAVTGGAGLLASYAIPLAKQRRLTVLADAAEKDRDLVAGFGADHVLPRGEDFVEAVRELEPGGVSGLLDTALLGPSVLPALSDEGEIAVVRGWQHGEPDRNIQVHRVMVREVLARTEWLEELRRLASSGELQLRVAKRFPPEQAADAHRLMEAGGIRGRAVIVF